MLRMLNMGIWDGKKEPLPLVEVNTLSFVTLGKVLSVEPIIQKKALKIGSNPSFLSQDQDMSI